MSTESLTGRGHSGFSLPELLAVLLIVGILMAMAVPGIIHVQRAHQLSKAAVLLRDHLQLARQLAITRNKPVVVSLCETSDESGNAAFNTLLLSQFQPDGTLAPVSRPFRLPQGFGISTNTAWSSMMELDLTTIRLSSGEVSCRQFRFNPSGSTDLTASGDWTLTLHHTGTEPVPDSLFIILALDPATGRIFSYQP